MNENNTLNNKDQAFTIDEAKPIMNLAGCKDETKTEIIARRFSQALLDNLDKEQIIELLFKNQQNSKENKDACASHDYFDANVFMSDTFHELGLEKDLWDRGGDLIPSGMNLWNRAWKLAKRKDFFITLGEKT